MHIQSTLSLCLVCLTVCLSEVFCSEVTCIKSDLSSMSGQQLLETCDERLEDNGVPEHFCFSVWKNVRHPNPSPNSGLTVHMQGCITSMLGLKDYKSCRQQECVAIASQEEHDNRMLFCCCNTTRCNQNFTWKPRETQSTTTTQPELQQVYRHSLVLSILGCVGVISLISAVMLVICLVLQNRSRVAFRHEKKKKKNRTDLPFSEGDHLISPLKEENELDCPVCLAGMEILPPFSILQCSARQVICQTCKKNKNIQKKCPASHQVIEERATASLLRNVTQKEGLKTANDTEDGKKEEPDELEAAQGRLEALLNTK